MPLHQMPAVNPDPERLADETSVKTIQTKVNNKLDPALPVCARIRRRAESPLRPSHAALTPPIAQPPRCSLFSPYQYIHHHVQRNDMPQSEPAGQEQMAPVQQERRLGPT